jgi:hypothetical protein
MMIMRKRIVVFAVTLLAMLGLAASPAHASYADCDWGTVCLWTGTDGTGTIYRLRGVAGQCINMVGGGVNSADSYANRREGNISHHVQFYDDFGCTGILLQVAHFDGGPIPSGAEGNFTVFRTSRGTHRNRVNSVWFNNG